MTINELSFVIQIFGKNDKANQKNIKKQTSSKSSNQFIKHKKP
jgi:hypothetical protein